MDTEMNSSEVVDVDVESRLVLDFTPLPADSEWRQRCIDLWKIIDEDPEMDWWHSVSKELENKMPVQEPDTKSKIRKPTAVDMLDFVKETGLYELVHNTKMNRSCSIECCENLKTQITGNTKTGTKVQGKASKDFENTDAVCKELRQWDKLQRKL